MTRRALAVAVFLIAAGPALSAEDTAGYASLVAQYSSGDAVSAITELARWSPASASSALDGWIRARPGDELRAAVMLHTDLAYVWLSTGRPAAARVHVRYADRLVRALIQADRAAPMQAFAIRWYAFTTSMYTAEGVIDLAARTVNDGLTEFPRAAELYVARGRIQEMRATQLPVSLSRTTPSLQIGRLLENAAADFQQAIDLDNSLAAAYLHRGRVHLQLDDKRASRDLETALERAGDDRVRYLAHLFLGGAAEQRADLETARREFEAARSLGPYQTAAVALSRVEDALGHVNHARAVAHAFTERVDPAEDPWWDYRLGFDSHLLEWLRREARHE